MSSAPDRPLRIAYITAGAAGMYCGTCLQDNTLAARLLKMGQDVILIPTYTPIRTDETDVSIDRVFYGAINVFLEQKSALFRHTPWLMDRVLNGKSLLRWASKRGTSVDARELGALTLSVLQGAQGKQSKELDKLVAWLADDIKPDIVHISNSMLLGLASGIRAALGVPVVCSLQGEDIYLDELREPFRTQVHDELKKKAASATGFVCASQYYADYMVDYLAIDRKRINIIPLGISVEGFESKDRVAESPQTEDAPFTIGFLARICPEKGLHVLVESFRRLAELVGREKVQLRIAGYLGPRDQDYFDGIMEQIRNWGLDDRVTHVGEVDRNQKFEFLRSLDVLSVPTTYREPKGLFVLEALASGVPVVLPRHGAFPEMIEATSGGLLVDPDDPEKLAIGLREVMESPEERAEMGRRGQEAVRREYNDVVSASKLLQLYQNLLQ